MGFLDTGGNVIIIWLHGDNVGPYLQGTMVGVKGVVVIYNSPRIHRSAAMHFSFGLGAFIAPIIVGWFIEIDNGDPTW